MALWLDLILDSAFLGIVLGYGATLMGYIYYGVPVGAGN